MSPACPSVEQLAEHLDARHHRLLRVVEADDLDLVVHLHHAALDAARRHRAAALDREHVLDRHQERLVDVAHRLRDLRVERLEQLRDRLLPLRVALQRRQRRAAHDRRVVAVELVLVQELADLHLHQVEHLRVVHRVALVQEDHDVVQADLARQQHVLARLRHHAVERAHHQDRAVHLRRARDHVLDVVGVAGAIDVRVVALRRLVLHVRSPRSSPSWSRRGPSRPWRCPRT